MTVFIRGASRACPMLSGLRQVLVPRGWNRDLALSFIELEERLEECPDSRMRRLGGDGFVANMRPINDARVLVRERLVGARIDELSGRLLANSAVAHALRFR